MNQDFTITAFNEPITALENTPQMSAAELKRRFQAPSDELREAHNALAESHAVLDEKVGGIVERTFEGAVGLEMLDRGVQQIISEKLSMEYGFYTGDGVYPREIVLGYTPRAVLIMRTSGVPNSYYPFCAFALPETNETEANTYCKLTENGFMLTEGSNSSRLNHTDQKMCYIALR